MDGLRSNVIGATFLVASALLMVVCAFASEPSATPEGFFGETCRCSMVAVGACEGSDACDTEKTCVTPNAICDTYKVYTDLKDCSSTSGVANKMCQSPAEQFCWRDYNCICTGEQPYTCSLPDALVDSNQITVDTCQPI